MVDDGVLSSVQAIIRITNYELQITFCFVRIADYEFLITNYLRATTETKTHHDIRLHSVPPERCARSHTYGLVLPFGVAS